MAFAVIALIVGAYLALSNLPALTPAPEVQIPAGERLKLSRWDHGLKCLVWTVLFLVFAIVISFPLRRRFRH